MRGILARQSQNRHFRSDWHARSSQETRGPYAIHRSRNEMCGETPTSLLHYRSCWERRLGLGVATIIGKSHCCWSAMFVQNNPIYRAWMDVKWRRWTNVYRSPKQLWWEPIVALSREPHWKSWKAASATPLTSRMQPRIGNLGRQSKWSSSRQIWRSTCWSARFTGK